MFIIFFIQFIVFLVIFNFHLNSCYFIPFNAFSLRLFNMPLFPLILVNKNKIPKGVYTTRHLLLEHYPPEEFNYFSSIRSSNLINPLTGEPLKFEDVDNPYGYIHTKEVLIKQVKYFISQDRFDLARKVLIQNRGLLTHSDANQLFDFSREFIRSNDLQSPQQFERKILWHRTPIMRVNYAENWEQFYKMQLREIAKSSRLNKLFEGLETTRAILPYHKVKNRILNRSRRHANHPIVCS